MNFTFQCQVVLGPKFKLAQAHEPGNMLSRADSLGTPRMAIPPRVLAAATLMQTRVVPKLRIGSSHTGAHIFTPQQTDTHTQSPNPTHASNPQQHTCTSTPWPHTNPCAHVHGLPCGLTLASPASTLGYWAALHPHIQVVSHTTALSHR